MQEVILDVRESDEYLAEHIEHSINLPLSDFNSTAPGVLKLLQDKKIYIMCRTGKRAELAKQMIADKSLHHDHISIYEGGIKNWIASGKPVNSCGKFQLPILRQVQLTVGVLVTVFALLAFLVDTNFSLVAAAMGLGLFSAGASGTCMLANAIAKMPWNKAPQKLEGANAQA